MQLTLKIIAVFLAIYFSACTASDHSLSESDKQLQKKIVGSWEAKNRGMIQLNSDGTFTDTLLTPLLFAENTYVVNYVLSGKFEIKDGNLLFYEAGIEYSRDIVNKPLKDLVYIFDPRRISFEDNFLMLQEFRMFFSDSIGQKSIYGKWEHENYACVYEHNSKQNYKCGKINETFIFNSDLTCRYERKYLFNTSLNDESNSKSYYYKHPHLEIDSLENALVVFNENKMIWFQNDPVFYTRRNEEKE
ncbi:MAG: hypothetical protein IPM56_11270 [Ignavibacteriales bacterium]|nr:MAG: hypothetical protein IPM56_11270 [Ignavibacteriales bacterium]